MCDEKQNGFTLIELLIVVAVIGILAGIAIPNFLNARIRAQTAGIISNMRTTHVLLAQYILDDPRGRYPHWCENMKWPDGPSPRSYTPSGDEFYNMGFPAYMLTYPVSYASSVDMFTTAFMAKGKIRDTRHSFCWMRFGAKNVRNLCLFEKPPRMITGAKGYGGSEYCKTAPLHTSDQLQQFSSGQAPANSAYLLIGGGPSSGNPSTYGPELLLYDPTNGVSAQGQIMGWGGSW